MEREKKTFFAMMSRMKYINRWALMRNSTEENISEHSLEVGMLAYALAVIGNRRLGQSYNAEHAAVLGMYHDCTEIITGDMPTPIKYENEQIRSAYKQIEKGAAFRLLNMLPADLRPDFEDLLNPSRIDDSERLLVKAADKLSALIKCIEEEKAGNQEFLQARQTVENTLENLQCPEAAIFLKEFIPEYYKTLDEM